MQAKNYLRIAILALPVFSAACADFDLFEEKKTPLTGERKAMFPAGVPGIEYNAPPPQPTNSNIPINTQVTNTGTNQPQENPDAAQPVKQKNSRAATRAQPAPRSAAKPVANDDPWADSRTPN
jgi:hypothetical protein